MKGMAGFTKPRLVIVGGSVGGLFLGNILMRAGWQVDIFERVTEELASRGAGIAEHAAMVPIMTAAGIVAEGGIGIEMPGRTAYDRFGTIIARYPYPQYIAAWSLVFNPLRAAFPREHYHQGRQLVGITRRMRSVAAHFADGGLVEADLIVGADGFRSTVRALEAPEIVARYARYVAWRGLVDEINLPAQFTRETFGNFAFCFPPRGQFIGYPLAGRDDSHEAGHRRYNFIWYTHLPEEDLADLLTDYEGVTHEYSIPPPLIRSEHSDALKQQAAALLPPMFSEVVERAQRYMVQPVYDVESAHIAFDRVALLGDAAFVARPHVGIGVLKAAEDAFELMTCLAGSLRVEDALAQYEKTRVAAGRSAVAVGRYLGSFIERGLAGPQSDPSLGLSPEKIIRISARPVPEIIECLNEQIGGSAFGLATASTKG
jgi:2-polyprenyl-6-methoxyphenol hydroxylase-like FAD-dependent oxidoreductase